MKACLRSLVAPTAATAALCIFLAGCAQTGPPLPPSLELPKPPGDLHASRKGNRVTLSWSEPAQTTDRQSVRYLGPTLICRSPETEITTCGNPVGTAPPPPVVPQKSASRRATGQRSASPRPAPQIFTDTLPATMLKPDPGAEVTYAVEVLNRYARGAGLSDRVHVPAIITLPPPSDLSAELTGDGVILSWTSAGEPAVFSSQPTSNSPGLQFRYRIYRRDESGKDAIAGEVPVSGSGPIHFADAGFEWEKAYSYRVTVVGIIQRPDNETQVEGDDSPPIHVVAHDIFPPDVPIGLQAAYSGEGQRPFIDLIWAPVTNADLAGYNIYRGETNGAVVGKLIKINSDLVKSPAYRDSEVKSGKMYTYSVSAVDVRGNESARSEETSEPVP